MPNYWLNGESEDRISKLVGLDLDAVGYEYQNWDHELPDAKYVKKLLPILPHLEDPNDALAAFAMLVASYQEYVGWSEGDKEVEEDIRHIVKAHPKRYIGVIGYWGCVDDYPLSDRDYPQEDCWNITGFMRDLLENECGIVPKTTLYALSQKSATFIASQLGLEIREEYDHGDWNEGLAKAEYVEKLLNLWPQFEYPDDIEAAFAFLISSYDSYILERYIQYSAKHGRCTSINACRDEELEEAIRQIVKNDPRRFICVLEFWSKIDYWPLDQEEDLYHDASAVTEFARELLKSICIDGK